MTARLAKLDAGSLIVDLVQTNDVAGNPGAIVVNDPAADLGWKHNPDGTWSDTPTAAAIRAQRASDDATNAPLIAGRTRGQNRVAFIRDAITARGMTLEDVTATLAYLSLKRDQARQAGTAVPALKTIETQYVTIVEQAMAAFP